MATVFRDTAEIGQKELKPRVLAPSSSPSPSDTDDFSSSPKRVFVALAAEDASPTLGPMDRFLPKLSQARMPTASQLDPLYEFSQVPADLEAGAVDSFLFDSDELEEEELLRAPLFTNTQVSELRDDDFEEAAQRSTSENETERCTVHHTESTHDAVSGPVAEFGSESVSHTAYGTDGYVRLKLPEHGAATDSEVAIGLIRRAERIVVVAGAGISVSAGIPDFRSVGSGLYSRISRLLSSSGSQSSGPLTLFEGGMECNRAQLEAFCRLDEPESLFDLDFFQHDPVPFYVWLWATRFGAPERMCFAPTLTHRVLAALPNLHLIFTQNIDTLEASAGLSSSKVCYCHGAFDRIVCIRCGAEEGLDAFWGQMERFAAVERTEDLRAAVPQCSQCPDYGDDEDEGDGGGGEVAPLLKPRVVFFGEPLPAAFFAQLSTSLQAADLLIVTGSSLKVLPVASIPDLLPPTVPQILINREPIGDHNFDVELIGEADDIWAWLAKGIGLDAGSKVEIGNAGKVRITNAVPGRFIFEQDK